MSVLRMLSPRKPASAGLPAGQAGFTMVELMIAILLLLVGVVAVAQLIPAAMDRNLKNRYDSTGLILCQRQLELMVSQPTDVGNPAAGAHFSFVATRPNGTNVTIRMGLNDTNPANQPVGAPIVTLPGGQLAINWSQPASAVPAGYIDNFVNAEGYQYQTRWNVMTFFANIGGTNQPVGKRIIISTRGGPRGANQLPTTIMTMVGFKQR